MSILIRKFRKEDALKVANIIKKGFLSLAPKYYSQKSVMWQIDENSPKKLLEKAKKVHYFVAVENKKILGIGGYNGEKVHTFFVRPEIYRKGVGSKIIERCFHEAKKQGIKKLKCWATFNAEKFYSKFGFKKNKKITIRSKNNSITFIEMVKFL